MRKNDTSGKPLRTALVGLLLTGLAMPRAALAQAAPAGPTPATASDNPLAGRVVEEVRILGNQRVSSAVIRNAIRTRAGEALDPGTVQEDYKRIYGLGKFTNVEARAEPTETGGVVVVFVVSEQRQIQEVGFKGNRGVSTQTLQELIGIGPGDAIDRFRVSIARQEIEHLYRERNYPFVRVEVPPEPLAERGELIFNVAEGPRVRVRKVRFVGAETFGADRLKKQTQTRSWVPILNDGTFDEQRLEDDVASLRRYYQSKGFFDVRVGRKVVWSPDLSEAMVDFVIEEGPRYLVEEVEFQGNVTLPEAELRRQLRLTEGMPYDADRVQRDVRQVVRAYSPYGYIYQPRADDPDFLRVDVREVFGLEPGRVKLVYQIREGKPFQVGRVIVKGNTKTQDKIILRELRVAPGEMYNSAELQDAAERLRATPFFQNVQITPVGQAPAVRDILVEVEERSTASFNVGAGVSSNGGVGGNINYVQRNFDLTDWPADWRDVFSERAFTGAGQTLRLSFEPGTEFTNASIYFAEPYVFDQPFSFSAEAYWRKRVREHYDDRRAGGRVSFGHKFDDVWSGLLSLRGEDVEIDDIEDPAFRAPEIIGLRGHNTLTSAGLQVRRDTTNAGILPYRGTIAVAAWESFGALGGDFHFQKFTASWDYYQTLYEDLLDRKTIFSLRSDAGYISGEAPFFERFYAGGIGSVRGFEFRGISPRSGIDEDRVGGDFVATTTAELSFPLAGDDLRGVVFVDAGTVEEEAEFGTVRVGAGAGIRMMLPFFGNAPLAVDFAAPLNKDEQDDTQIFSFSFGVVQ